MLDVQTVAHLLVVNERELKKLTAKQTELKQSIREHPGQKFTTNDGSTVPRPMTVAIVLRPAWFWAFSTSMTWVMSMEVPGFLSFITPGLTLSIWTKMPCASSSA